MSKSFAAALLSCLLLGELAASPAVIASNNDSKAGAAANAPDQKSSADHAQPKEPKREDNLDTCKRDADGMKGPERSRFMTQCLKERR